MNHPHPVDVRLDSSTALAVGVLALLVTGYLWLGIGLVRLGQVALPTALRSVLSPDF